MLCHVLASYQVLVACARQGTGAPAVSAANDGMHISTVMPLPNRRQVGTTAGGQVCLCPSYCHMNLAIARCLRLRISLLHAGVHFTTD